MLTRLTDGTRAVIRPIRSEDKGLLSDGIGRLSLESSRARFLTPKTSLTAAELRYLTEVDGAAHVAFVAVTAAAPVRLLGVGRYVRLADDPQTAEIAIVIADDHHGLGLGSRLGLILADHARRQGVRRFVATMLTDNLAAHRLFAKISERLRSSSAGGVDELIADLAA